MQRILVGALAAGVASLLVVASARAADEAKGDIPKAEAEAIEKAAPDQPPAKPAKPRKLLVYGRVPTHGEPVIYCFRTMEILGKKTGAFETVASGDPKVFLPESLKQFDAIVMNNTHEATPWLPWNLKELDEPQQKAAREQEGTLKKSFLDFVANGRGLVGIHGAACSVQWPEYMELVGGAYAGHVTGSVWVKPLDPAHALCAGLDGESFEVNDEIYIFGPPFSREKVRVLMGLDMSKTKDPGNRPDKDYAVSWVREYGKGRVFYCSLGHAASSYRSPQVLRHVLAGIQFAIGDLPADAKPIARKE